MTAKEKAPSKKQEPAVGTYINWDDKLKFDADFKTDWPTVSFSMENMTNNLFDGWKDDDKKSKSGRFKFKNKKKGDPAFAGIDMQASTMPLDIN